METMTARLGGLVNYTDKDVNVDTFSVTNLPDEAHDELLPQLWGGDVVQQNAADNPIAVTHTARWPARAESYYIKPWRILKGY